MAEPAFTVAVRIEEGGRTVATPRLTTTLDRPVSIMADGPDGYTVRLTLRRGSPDSDRILIESELTRRLGQAWVPVAIPPIAAVLGQSDSAGYRIGDRAGRVHMTVSPNVATLSTL